MAQPTKQDYDRMDRQSRRRILICVIAVFLFALITGKRREYTYKRVIYDYEHLTNQAEVAADSTDIVRMIGKPNMPYYRLPHRPRFPRFWERYD